MNSTYQNILKKFFHSETTNDYTLEKITHACAFFGNPQNSFKSIHIAGTNGKGSVSKMIFQMLKESGKRVWVYTSPHNIDIRERFETANYSVDWLISEERFVSYVEQIVAYGWGLSYYEKCVLLAFLYFRDCECEYAIIEVGMGGRLDATNVIMPILSVITSISYDHMEHLGYTLEAIATEKWGIIKPGIPVILYDKNPTLVSIAHEQSAPIISPETRSVTTNLLGEHQISNARIAYEAGIFLGIEEETIENALLHVDHHGRLEYLRPNILIDGAHNEDGIKKLKNYIESLDLSDREIVYCINLKKGKSYRVIMDIYSERKNWIIVDSDHQMVEDAGFLLQSIIDAWYHGEILTPREIMALAKDSPEKFFVIFGSLYMMGEFLENESIDQ